MELDRKKAAIIKTVYYGGAIVLALLGIRYLYPLILPFLFGFFIAWVLRPVVCFLDKHSKIGKRGAAIVSAIIFYSLLITLCALIGTALYGWGQRMVSHIPEFYQQTLAPAVEETEAAWYSLFGGLLPVNSAGQISMSNAMNTAAESIFAATSEWLAGFLANIIKSAPGIVIATIFAILSSVFYCVDYDTVKDFIMGKIPLRFHRSIHDAKSFLAGTLWRLACAYLILTALTFCGLMVGLWILGVDGFLKAAAVIALLDLLPVIGSGTVLIPWGIWGFVSGDQIMGCGMIVLWAVISFIRQFAEPKIISNQIQLHPLITLISMYIGLKVAGIVGLLFMPVLCLLIKHLTKGTGSDF